MSTLKLEKIESLQGTGNTVITFDSSDRAVFAQPPLTAVPAFFAYKSGNKNLTSGAWTTADINDVVFDTHWDGTNNSSVGFNKTNFRYIAPIAGYYRFDISLYIRASSSLAQLAVGIAKNGASGTGIFGGYVTSGSGAAGATGAGGVLYMNGSTDYIEGTVYATGTSPYVDGGGNINLGSPAVFNAHVSYLTGFLVRAGAE